MSMYYFEKHENGPGYTIDYTNRLIETDYAGRKIKTPFSCAFSRAMDCQIHVEDGSLPNVQENLFLAVYQKYLLWAPRDLPAGASEFMNVPAQPVAACH